MWVLYVECIPALCRCTLAEKSEWIARGTSTYTSSGRETNLSIAKRGATDETILYRIWSLLLSLPSLNVRLEFFRFLGDEKIRRRYLCYAYFVFPIILHFALFVIRLFYLWVLFADCKYALENSFWILWFICWFLSFMLPFVILVSFVSE